ncbi:MAG: DUF4249 family protein [Salinivirgaceae bacterium]|nr:DUF4249 family protein [Salinivirgaceae bacterium]MBR6082803.1 DUF4249 family protein [Salinivirgaceae bacterium]
MLLTACTEEEVILDLQNTEMPYQIVVSGGVYSIYGNQFLKLTQPSKSRTNKSFPVTGANIEVSDGINTYKFRETENEGEYESIEEFAGEVGKTYFLKIDCNGRTYYASDSMTMTDEIKIEDFPAADMYYYASTHRAWNNPDSIITEGRVMFYIDYHNFGYDNAAMWLLWSKAHPSTSLAPSLRRIALESKYYYSHKGSPPQGIYPTTATSTGARCESGDTIELIKVSLSDSYYDYQISKFNLTEWSGGMFSTIPGNVKTNLSKGATGYFCACDVKTRFYTFNELFEYVKNNESNDEEDNN